MDDQGIQLPWLRALRSPRSLSATWSPHNVLAVIGGDTVHLVHASVTGAPRVVLVLADPREQPAASTAAAGGNGNNKKTVNANDDSDGDDPQQQQSNQPQQSVAFPVSLRWHPRLAHEIFPPTAALAVLYSDGALAVFSVAIETVGAIEAELVFCIDCGRTKMITRYVFDQFRQQQQQEEQQQQATNNSSSKMTQRQKQLQQQQPLPTQLDSWEPIGAIEWCGSAWNRLVLFQHNRVAFCDIVEVPRRTEVMRIKRGKKTAADQTAAVRMEVTSSETGFLLVRSCAFQMEAFIPCDSAMIVLPLASSSFTQQLLQQRQLLLQRNAAAVTPAIIAVACARTNTVTLFRDTNTDGSGPEPVRVFTIDLSPYLPSVFAVGVHVAPLSPLQRHRLVGLMSRPQQTTTTQQQQTQQQQQPTNTTSPYEAAVTVCAIGGNRAFAITLLADPNGRWHRFRTCVMPPSAAAQPAQAATSPLSITDRLVHAMQQRQQVTEDSDLHCFVQPECSVVLCAGDVTSLRIIRFVAHGYRGVTQIDVPMLPQTDAEFDELADQKQHILSMLQQQPGYRPPPHLLSISTLWRSASEVLSTETTRGAGTLSLLGLARHVSGDYLAVLYRGTGAHGTSREWTRLMIVNHEQVTPAPTASSSVEEEGERDEQERAGRQHHHHPQEQASLRRAHLTNLARAVFEQQHSIQATHRGNLSRQRDTPSLPCIRMQVAIDECGGVWPPQHLLAHCGVAPTQHSNNRAVKASLWNNALAVAFQHRLNANDDGDEDGGDDENGGDDEKQQQQRAVAPSSEPALTFRHLVRMVAEMQLHHRRNSTKCALAISSQTGRVHPQRTLLLTALYFVAGAFSTTTAATTHGRNASSSSSATLGVCPLPGNDVSLADLSEFRAELIRELLLTSCFEALDSADTLSAARAWYWLLEFARKNSGEKLSVTLRRAGLDPVTMEPIVVAASGTSTAAGAERRQREERHDNNNGNGNGVGDHDDDYQVNQQKQQEDGDVESEMDDDATVVLKPLLDPRPEFCSMLLKLARHNLIKRMKKEHQANNNNSASNSDKNTFPIEPLERCLDRCTVCHRRNALGIPLNFFDGVVCRHSARHQRQQQQEQHVGSVCAITFRSAEDFSSVVVNDSDDDDDDDDENDDSQQQQQQQKQQQQEAKAVVRCVLCQCVELITDSRAHPLCRLCGGLLSL